MRVQVPIAILLVAAAIAGCSDGDPATGGSGLPAQVPGESYPGARQSIGGVVEVGDDGCVTIEFEGRQLFVIWPTGSTWTGSAVALPGAETIEPGTRIEATAAAIPVQLLPGWPDGRWGNDVGFCDPDAERVIVIDAVG